MLSTLTSTRNPKDAAKHKDVLDVRVGVKSADVSKHCDDNHEYFAAVTNVREMSAVYPKEMHCVFL